MSPNNNSITFNFKLVFTDTVRRYTFDKNMRLEDFIKDIQNRIKNDFQLTNIQTVEVIEAGQPQAEMAPGIIHNNMTIKDKYAYNGYMESFYIRLEQHITN